MSPFNLETADGARRSWVKTVSRKLIENFMKTLAALIVIAATSLAVKADTGRTGEYDYDPPEPGTYTLPVIKPAADGALLDSAGKPIRLAQLTRGRITVVSFIYTRCAAARAMPRDARRSNRALPLHLLRR